ncbi:hypothetical protein J6590_052937 [Homalodisca vitripennis]|nr:hypothetical protein J6590_052937 [Homalodisca vitripennis]
MSAMVSNRAHRLASTEKKPTYVGAKLWNALPLELKMRDRLQKHRFSRPPGTDGGSIPQTPPRRANQSILARASTKDPSLPIQNSDHAMLARCAALCAACSFREKLTRACKVQAQINSPRHTEQEKLSITHAGFITGKR